jgi:sirohydrochlorin cobaltochelatase
MQQLIDAPLTLPSEWQTFATDKGGVLVVGHGTRKKSGTEQLLRLVDQIRQRLPGLPVEGCFLELAFPSIGEGLVQLLDRGCRQFVSVPILLFSAGHARKDIPDEVRPAAKLIGLQQRGQSSPLELTDEVIRLSQRRYESALHDVPSADQASVGLAMVGRGSSYRTAIAKMHRLTAIRASQSQPEWHATGFFAAAKPTVRELFERAAATDCRTIVIQPHLLFDGLLMDELRGLHSEFSEEIPTKRWILADCLGADELLADTYVQLARKTL